MPSGLRGRGEPSELRQKSATTPTQPAAPDRRSSVVGYIAGMRCVFPFVMLVACGPAFPLDDVLRANHVQVVGTHNSYHVMTADIPQWRYTHAPLDEQIAEQGVRQFELDAYWDADTQTWSIISPYMEADREVVDALIAEDSAAFAAENNITPRDCN